MKTLIMRITKVLRVGVVGLEGFFLARQRSSERNTAGHLELKNRATLHIRRLKKALTISLLFSMVWLSLPAQAFALNLGDLVVYDRSRELQRILQSRWWLNRPIAVQNNGVYPIISVQVDHQEVLAPGQVLWPGDTVNPAVSILTTHEVEVTFGTDCSNYYGACLYPLWITGYTGVSSGSSLVFDDWSVREALPLSVWHGTYLDNNNNWRDSTFTFFGNGTVIWQLSGAQQLTGTYSDVTVNGVNTYLVSRDVFVSIGGQTDTLILLEYENTLNVFIDGRWVPHAP